MKLQITIEDDGTAELFATVEANGFRGHGSGWVSQGELSELGLELAEAFPLRDKIELNAGYWSRSDPGAIEQEHLALSFYPVEGRGVVGCQVRLATELLSCERPESQQHVRVELLTSYQELRRFSGDLCALATGDADEAILHAAMV